MKRVTAIIFLLIIFAFACYKDAKFDRSPNFELHFSNDSVIFDTIFSGIGSVTKYFKIYNTSSKDVEIDRIYLAKNTNSNYNININGSPLKSSSNVILKSKDSMYVFVEVLVNTDKDALQVKDSVVFVTNGNHQDVKLIAWGQDVNLINEKVIKTTNWTNDKPYLIYNSILVDTNAVLHIEQGTKIHFHKGSTMYVAGTLEIAGTSDNRVLLQADRLEKLYEDVPGQWNGIWFLSGSKNNIINYAEIKNAFTGIRVDTLANINKPILSLHNTKIEHCSYAGLLAKGSTVFATNCLIADCGYFILALTIGGKYNFYNCTFANYWQNSIRETPSVILNNYYNNEDGIVVRDIEHAGFYNCVIYGNRPNEIVIDKYTEVGNLNYEFKNCLLKYSDNANLNNSYLKDCFNENPLFLDIEKYNFALDTLSPAINKASMQIIDTYPNLLHKDIEGVSRISDKSPDIGVYEWK